MKNEWIMRNKWIFFVAPLAIVLFVWIGGELVMHLWNWLLPPLFGWRQVTFWQALGLLTLCRILFGSFGGHRPDSASSRRKMGECREGMTPEEREKIRQEMRARYGGLEAQSGGTDQPA